MRSLFAVAALLLSGGAMAAEAVLVHDIAPPHPRYTQLTQMAADVARRTQGMLSIAINPVSAEGVSPARHRPLPAVSAEASRRARAARRT